MYKYLIIIITILLIICTLKYLYFLNSYQNFLDKAKILPPNQYKNLQTGDLVVCRFDYTKCCQSSLLTHDYFQSIYDDTLFNHIGVIIMIQEPTTNPPKPYVYTSTPTNYPDALNQNQDNNGCVLIPLQALFQGPYAKGCGQIFINQTTKPGPTLKLDQFHQLVKDFHHYQWHPGTDFQLVKSYITGLKYHPDDMWTCIETVYQILEFFQILPKASQNTKITLTINKFLKLKKQSHHYSDKYLRIL